VTKNPKQVAKRRTADVAGIDWKSAVYRKVAEEVTAGQRLSIERMVELGRVSRLILAFWFGPPTAVKFGPPGRHWLGFMDGAREA
jgi:hypothetical protein